MKRYLRASFLVLIVLCLGVVAAHGADTSLGILIHPWTSYPSEAFDFDSQVRYTVGPTLSFRSGWVSSIFWYAVDPNRTGTLCTIGGFGTPGDETTTLRTLTEEVGWRLSTSGNVFLSASVARFRWTATTLCSAELTSSLSSTTIAAGGGFRFSPLWGAFEVGIRWTEASDDFTDVGDAPETFVMLNGGLELQLNQISEQQLRYTVPALAVVFSEEFPVGCDDWEWTGQTGQVSVIDEQLGITVKQREQQIIQPLGVEEARYVADMSVITRSTASAEHSFGVVIRYVDDANYYCVEIRTDGHVRLAQMVDGDYRGITAWSRTNALRAGEANALRIVVPGNRVITYLNGRRILDTEEVSFTSGGIGLFAHTYDSPGTWVAFDDIVIRRLEQGMIVDPRSQAARDVETVERLAFSILSGVGAFIANQEGMTQVACGLAGFSMFELLFPSTHVFEVK